MVKKNSKKRSKYKYIKTKSQKKRSQKKRSQKNKQGGNIRKDQVSLSEAVGILRNYYDQNLK